MGSAMFLTVVLLFGAIGEEMLFRGYGFQVLCGLVGPFATVLPTAILFSAAHSRNENMSTLGLVNTFLWGVVLGYAFLRSGDLWLPIGLHFGWNWVAPLAGVNLSGFTMGVTGFTFEWKASELWSGGAYGPEGGILCSAVCVLLLFVLRRVPIASQQPFLMVRHESRETFSEQV
jgi:membrane protease YdiL (CAAX protease family)